MPRTLPNFALVSIGPTATPSQSTGRLQDSSAGIGLELLSPKLSITIRIPSGCVSLCGFEVPRRARDKKREGKRRKGRQDKHLQAVVVVLDVGGAEDELGNAEEELDVVLNALREALFPGASGSIAETVIEADTASKAITRRLRTS